MPGPRGILRNGADCLRRLWRARRILKGAQTACFAVALFAAAPLRAEPIALGGLIFSDELGGIRIVDGWGEGGLDDPFVIVEEITGDGPAILTIRGLTPAFGNRIGSHHLTGFALTKIVRNRTDSAWAIFDLELREALEDSSPYGDGLSFGQAAPAGRPFQSDGYETVHETLEPVDVVSFTEGLIRPTESVGVSVIISDTSPRPVFFLVQSLGSIVSQADSFPESLCVASPSDACNVR